MLYYVEDESMGGVFVMLVVGRPVGPRDWSVTSPESMPQSLPECILAWRLYL